MGVKLGQKWAIKDGNLLASNQVGSRFFNKEFDFSRASNGTYVDRDGLLKTAELYNLIPYSEDFSQWTTSNTSVTSGQTGYDGTNKAWLLESATDGNARRIQQSVSTSGEQTFSLYAKKGSVNFVIIYANGVSGRFFDLNNGTLGSTFGGTPDNSEITEISNGWYRCSITINASSTAMLIYPIATNGSLVTTAGDNIYIQNAQINQGTEPLDYQYTNGLQGLPRISFEDGVGHLLLEPQRSNLLTWSSDYTQSAWNLNTEINILSNNANSPDGNLNASKIIPTINNVSHYVSRSSQSIIGHNYSVFAKADGYDWILLTSHTTSAPATRGTYFNIKNGTIGTIGTLTQNAKIEDYGNGWYRCSIDEGSSPSSLFSVHIVNENDGLAFSGDGIKGVLLWGAQREAGSYPTSIIETTTTSVTRLADVCNNSGSAQDFNSEEGVLYAEIARGGDENDTYQLLSIMDSTEAIRLGFGKNLNNNWYIRAVIDSLSINVPNIPFEEGFQKIAFKYKSGDSAVWLNGVEIHTDTTSFTTNLNFSELNFNWTTSSYPFYGKVRNVQVFTEALSDAELQQLTT